MTEYRIQLATPAHVDPLPEIERAAARLFEGLHIPELDLEETTPLEEFREAQRQGQLFVAVSTAGDVVGFAMVHEHAGDAHLEELGVHPGHGRRGLGTRLVGAVCDFAARRGLRAVTLTTFREIPWNEPFYRSQGFDEIPEAELSQELREILAEEAERGLDPARRVVMQRRVGPA